MPTDIQAPSIAYIPLLPILIVFGAATLGVLVEAFVPARLRRITQIVVSVTGLGAALAAVVYLAQEGTSRLVAESAIAVDGPTLFLQGTLCVLGIGSILLLSENRLDRSGGEVVSQAANLPGSRDDLQLAESSRMQTEVYPLALFALGGMLLFPASNNLLLSFVALEVLSLPLYLMAGLARRRRLLSQEAAVKYFLLGAFASAFFLYGVALLYGYAGSVDLGEILKATSQTGKSDSLLYLGIAMLGVGLLFKVGAVPFQAWTPDVYQGSPTPVTALMAACTKVAAFGALLRIFYVAFGTTQWDWRPMMWTIAILTMVVGAILAVTQTDVKRMLAYSSVAHTGFILVAVCALSATGNASKDGLSGALFYLLTYGFTTLASFAVVGLVRDSAGEATHLAQWAGLGKRSPLVAGVFAFLLFALAGIPLTSGFMAKFAVFKAGIEGGATALVVVGVIASAITAFFYARVVVLMFFQEPMVDGPTVAIPSVYTAIPIAFGLAVTAVLGVAPQLVLDWANGAATFIR
jgi:NADH-quinone oxidoreductase subunit N